MKADQVVTYKTLLDQLETVPSRDFFTNFQQIFTLLQQENSSKFASITNIIDNENSKLKIYTDKAIQELEPLLRQAEVLGTNRRVRKITNKIHLYREAKVGKINNIGENLVDSLYHSIRLTIEMNINKRMIKEFSSILTYAENDKFWYVDFQKICALYPHFKSFKYQQELQEKSIDQQIRAYIYLQMVNDFFKRGSSIVGTIQNREKIISNLRILSVYLLTLDKKEEIKPEKYTGIDKLYSLDTNNIAIYYEGNNKVEKQWIYPRGKTQSYAILKYALEKYLRQKALHTTNTVRLSLIEIKNYLENPKNCNKQPNWKAISSTKTRLEYLRKNIMNIIPFTANELHVENINNTPMLIFQIPH